MSPTKVRRDRLRRLSDLPNVGPAMSSDFELLGIRTPQQLRGKDPLALYRSLCRMSGVRQDPCVLDIIISVTRFMDGEAPRPWWAYTAERKRRFGDI